MTWITGETAAIVQLTAVGGLVLGAVWYRLHTWRYRRETVVRAMTASVAVFASFGLGVVLSLLGNRGPNLALHMNGLMLLVWPSLALLACQFWRGRPVTDFLGKAVLLFVLWALLFGLGSSGSMGATVKIMLFGIGLVSCCLVLGVINGLLGPLVPAVLIAQFLNGVLGGGAGWLDWPFSALIELMLGHLNESLRMLASVVLVVLGLAEFFAFFGVKVTTALDGVHDWVMKWP
jgi:hypothetical protein